MDVKDGETVDVAERSLVPAGHVEQRIISLRGQNVILDVDLAELYGVETKRLNEQVRRNAKRFPLDFVFQLSSDEYEVLRSHSATSSWGGRRYPPYAFTEHGALMCGGLLFGQLGRSLRLLLYGRVASNPPCCCNDRPCVRRATTNACRARGALQEAGCA